MTIETSLGKWVDNSWRKFGAIKISGENLGNSTSLYKDNPPPETVGIVIPVRDSLPFFKLAFHSVLSFTTRPYMLTIIDNMSSFPTRQYLDSLKRNHRVSVLKYQKEFNYSAECNLGIRSMFVESNVSYGLVLNSDVVVEPKWLENLLAALEWHNNVGIVGPVTNIAIEEQESKRNPGLRRTDYVSGFCMAFKRRVFETLGGFDEEYVGGCYEDRDFCERAKASLWDITINGAVYVHHFWRVSRDNDPTADKHVITNKIRFEKKHSNLNPHDHSLSMLPPLEAH